MNGEKPLWRQLPGGTTDARQRKTSASGAEEVSAVHSGVLDRGIGTAEGFERNGLRR